MLFTRNTNIKTLTLIRIPVDESLLKLSNSVESISVEECELFEGYSHSFSKMINKLTNISKIYLDEDFDMVNIMKAITLSSNNITEFEVDGSCTSENVERELKDLIIKNNNIKYLSLYSLEFDGECLKHLNRDTIKYLNLSFSTFNYDILGCFTEFTKLRKLILQDISWNGIDELKTKCTNLEVVL